MKNRSFLFTVLVCLLVSLTSVVFPASAESAAMTEAEQLDVTDTYYYDRLGERQQWCYDWLQDFYDNISEEIKEYKVDLSYLLPEQPTFNDYADLFLDFCVADSALQADAPLYRLKGDVTGAYFPMYGEEEPCFTLYIWRSDIHTADSVQQVTAGIDQIVRTIGDGDRYTKLRKMTHYIMSNTFYDPYSSEINYEGYDGLGGRGAIYNGSVYGFFLKDIAVCAGFSESVKVLCDAMDIPCIIIGNHAHAWNLVQMEDGSWYRIDATNASPLGWDGYTDIDDYYNHDFLNNHNFITGLGMYDNPYMLRVVVDYTHINIDYLKEFKITEFPELAEEIYEYKGSTADFSYTIAPSTYVPGEPTFSYKVNPDEKTCTVTNFEGKQSGDLIIPETLDGYTVTAIEDYAFYYCTGFTGKLVIPDTVETIGKAAFAGCYNLTSLDLSENLWKIEEGAFIGCKGLTEITLPDSVSHIENVAFYDCDKLKMFTFGRHVYSLGENVLGKIDEALLIKAPEGSEAQKYSKENNISFEVSGLWCSFVDADGVWNFDNDGHFHVCEHGVRFDHEDHTKEEGFGHCGDKCEICDASYCYAFLCFVTYEEVIMDARDATCNEPAYTGDTVCPVCHSILVRGESVGLPTGEHTPAFDYWDNDEFTHYKYCSCGEKFNIENHRGGIATEGAPALCEVCGVAYGTSLPGNTPDASGSETTPSGTEYIPPDEETSAPDELTTAKSDEETGAPDELTTAKPEESKGGTCGGIAIAAQLAALIFALGAVIIIKKK